MGHSGCLGDSHSEIFLDKGSPSCPLFPCLFASVGVRTSYCKCDI